MNIAFDATAILGPMSRNRGIGNYALAQFEKMLSLDKDNQYFFLNIFDKDFTFKEQYENLTEVHLWCGKDRFVGINPDYKEAYAGIIHNFIEKNNIDIFYVTSPFDGHIFPYEREWFGNAHVVATVYDIIPYVMQDTYLSEKNTRKWYMRCFEAFKHFDAYLVISESVKTDLIKHAGIPSHKIAVMHGAAEDRYQRIHVSENEKSELFSKFGIVGKLIMSTSGDDYRKNIAELITAYSQLPTELKQEYQLAIVCKLSQNGHAHYSQIIENLGLNGRVLLTGYVTDDELLKLYNVSSLMAFPSQYEGFGLPVVEAFACGTPVLTSNNSSLVEIAQDAAVLVDPFDIQDITRGLKYALTEADTRALVQKGYERLTLYQWDKVAEISVQTLKALGKSNPASKNSERVKVAMFTPLPPLQSGISDYAVDIIHALSDYCDIDVYVDDNYTPDCALPPTTKIRNHKQYKKNMRAYFDTIYQVGNSTFHTYMFDYIQKYKGTVVLHDYNLHLVAYAHTVHILKDPNAYTLLLQEDYSPEQINDLSTIMLEPSTSSAIRDETVAKYPLSGFISNYATKIIVHSHDSREKLLHRNIASCIRVIPHYAKIAPLVVNPDAKIKFGYHSDNLIFASFGHVHPTKRIMPILHAFNRLVKTIPNARYIFVGKLDGDLKDEFNMYVSTHHLEDKVSVTGYVDIDEFIDYIDIADICVNLRYPSNGETSGSLMRILAKGKCVVVNNIGSFGEIPNHCCVKLPDAAILSGIEEVQHIYDAMQKLSSDAHYRNELSIAARLYAESCLDASIIAQQYYTFINVPPPLSLKESMIDLMLRHEIWPKGYTETEIAQLSKTLAYGLSSQVKVPPPTPDPYREAIVTHQVRYGTNDDTGISSPLRSSLARRQDIVALRQWTEKLPVDTRASFAETYNRKQWEWVYIAQALHEKGMLNPGKRGIGFAVGREPLPALFASFGAKIVATDFPDEQLTPESISNWKDTNQHASDIEILAYPKICANDVFYQNVSFMPLDMNNIPEGLHGFDFCWSSCAFEHIGGETKACAFITNALKLLKPGGVAVHTTEYNISSAETIEDPYSAIFGVTFFDNLIARLAEEGHHVAPLDLRLGNHPDEDYIFDFQGEKPHFKLLFYTTVATSIGIIIVKGEN